MKKALLLAAAIAAAGPACADWLEVNEDGATKWFMDYSTLRVNGSSRRIWLMKDFQRPKVASGATYLSTKNFKEFDCGEDRSRVLKIIAYSGNKGSGTIVLSSESPWDWEPNVPDSNGKAVADIICGLPAKSF